MLLSIAFGILALLLVTAVVSASSIHLERKRLLALADLSALAAADAVSDETYYGRSATGSDAALVTLTPSGVRGAVEDHLSESTAASSFTDLTVVEATTDGRTAVVTLRSVAVPPLLSWATAPWSEGVPLQVTARARAG